jgi:hypothetical protein
MEGREKAWLCSKRSPMLISACMRADFVTVLFLQSCSQNFKIINLGLGTKTETRPRPVSV